MNNTLLNNAIAQVLQGMSDERFVVLNNTIEYHSYFGVEPIYEMNGDNVDTCFANASDLFEAIYDGDFDVNDQWFVGKISMNDIDDYRDDFRRELADCIEQFGFAEIRDDFEGMEEIKLVSMIEDIQSAYNEAIKESLLDECRELLDKYLSRTTNEPTLTDFLKWLECSPIAEASEKQFAYRLFVWSNGQSKYHEEVMVMDWEALQDIVHRMWNHYSKEFGEVERIRVWEKDGACALGEFALGTDGVITFYKQ